MWQTGFLLKHNFVWSSCWINTIFKCLTEGEGRRDTGKLWVAWEIWDEQWSCSSDEGEHWCLLNGSRKCCLSHNSQQQLHYMVISEVKWHYNFPHWCVSTLQAGNMWVLSWHCLLKCLEIRNFQVPNAPDSNNINYRAKTMQLLLQEVAFFIPKMLPGV